MDREATVEAGSEMGGQRIERGEYKLRSPGESVKEQGSLYVWVGESSKAAADT